MCIAFRNVKFTDVCGEQKKSPVAVVMIKYKIFIWTTEVNHANLPCMYSNSCPVMKFGT